MNENEAMPKDGSIIVGREHFQTNTDMYYSIIYIKRDCKANMYREAGQILPDMIKLKWELIYAYIMVMCCEKVRNCLRSPEFDSQFSTLSLQLFLGSHQHSFLHNRIFFHQLQYDLTIERRKVCQNRSRIHVCVIPFQSIQKINFDRHVME